MAFGSEMLHTPALRHRIELAAHRRTCCNTNAFREPFARCPLRRAASRQPGKMAIWSERHVAAGIRRRLLQRLYGGATGHVVDLVQPVARPAVALVRLKDAKQGDRKRVHVTERLGARGVGDQKAVELDSKENNI